MSSCLKSPGVPAWICIPLCPDPFRPLGDDTVDNAFLLSRRDEDDHVPLPHVFDTAGDENNPVPRPKNGRMLSPLANSALFLISRGVHRF